MTAALLPALVKKLSSNLETTEDLRHRRRNSVCRLSQTILAAFGFVILLNPSAFAQARSSLVPGDLVRIPTVSDAQISPEGDWVVYSVNHSEENQTINVLWLVRDGERTFPTMPTGRRPEDRRTEERRNLDFVRNPGRPLLPAGWNASNPRWSPDSKSIAFLATHDGQHGIWIVSLLSRTPRFVAPVRETNFFITYAGESFAWSPDSKGIAYISANEDLEDLTSNPNRSEDPHVIDRIQYKSRTSLSDRLRTHIWIVDLEKPDPESRQLTSGPFYDHALNFSPRGDEILFVSNHEPDPDANNNSDIFAVNLHGEIRQLTQTAGCEYQPVWSPDGKWIVYTATTRNVTTIDSVAEDTHVWLMDPNGDARRDLTLSLDRRTRSPRWAEDEKSVYFLFNDHGLTQIGNVRLDCSGSDCLAAFPTTAPAYISDQRGNIFQVPLPHNFQVGDFSVSSENVQRTAFTMSDPLHSAEVWIGLPGRKETVRPLSFHGEAIRSNTLREPESFIAQTTDGNQIQAWLLKPQDWREDRKYPLILSIHGGPHGMYGYAFNPTFQIYSGHGYAVLYLNPRGSNGYGQKFSDGTIGEWGGGDYRDLMTVVDEALRRYSWIDPARIGVIGGSYGGFMANWIISQTTRFRAAVSIAGLSNLISFYSTSLYQDLIHAEFGGFPWDNYELLWQWSPLRYVRQTQTPTLFLHGEQDNDVPITQSEEMYMALRRRGIETLLVSYPREGHGLHEPKHRIDALERTLAWFDRFLK